MLKMAEGESLENVVGLAGVSGSKVEGSSFVKLNVLKVSDEGSLVTNAENSEVSGDGEKGMVKVIGLPDVSEDGKEDDSIVMVIGLPDNSEGEEEETDSIEVVLFGSPEAHTHEILGAEIGSTDVAVKDTEEGNAVGDAESVTEIGMSVSELKELVIVTVCGAVL